MGVAVAKARAKKFRRPLPFISNFREDINMIPEVPIGENFFEIVHFVKFLTKFWHTKKYSEVARAS